MTRRKLDEPSVALVFIIPPLRVRVSAIPANWFSQKNVSWRTENVTVPEIGSQVSLEVVGVPDLRVKILGLCEISVHVEIVAPKAMTFQLLPSLTATVAAPLFPSVTQINFPADEAEGTPATL